MCVDVRAVVLVDRDPAAVVGRQPRLLQVELVGDALPAGGVHDHVRGDPLAAGQAGDRAARGDLDLRRPPRRSGRSPPGRAGGTSATRRSRGRRSRASPGRFSTTVTRVPSAANIEAYSMPITPAPTTTIESGTCSSCSTPSESSTRSPSNSTCDGRAGLVPVAITILSAVTVSWSPRTVPSTLTVCGSSNWAVPPRMSTWLRSSWLRMISISRPTTCWVRASRSRDGDLGLHAVALRRTCRAATSR